MKNEQRENADQSALTNTWSSSSEPIEVDPTDMVKALVKLSFHMNQKMDKSRARLLIEDLIADGWYPEEVISAARIIANSPEVAKEVRFSGVLAPYHFTLAREEMDAAGVKGHCFHYRDEYHPCKNPGTVEAWGDIYCEQCFRRHVNLLVENGRPIPTWADNELKRLDAPRHRNERPPILLTGKPDELMRLNGQGPSESTP